MRNKKVCPKCGEIDIIKIPGSVGAFGTGNNVPAGSFIPSSVKVTRYLCCTCGFSEEWIDAAEDIQKLKKKYKNS